jgi:hypothetical protein
LLCEDHPKVLHVRQDFGGDTEVHSRDAPNNGTAVRSLENGGRDPSKYFTMDNSNVAKGKIEIVEYRKKSLTPSPQQYSR